MIDTLAYVFGSYSTEAISVLLIILLLSIFGLGRVFEAFYQKLWRSANSFWGWLSSLPPVRYVSDRYPSIWKFMGRRLSPGGYLGLHLTIGIVLTVVALVIFYNLAAEVVHRRTLVEFDAALAQTLYDNVTPVEVKIFQIVTQLGGRLATFVIGIGVGLILIFYRRHLLLLTWAVAILGNSLLNAVLKALFQRKRPEFPNPFLVESNWSFPSGHAMGAVVIYGMLVYLLVVFIKSRVNKFIVVNLVIIFIILIGVSRLYLGVHFFSDVIAGYVAGAGWLAIVISGAEVARRRRTAVQPTQRPGER